MFIFPDESKGLPESFDICTGCIVEIDTLVSDWDERTYEDHICSFCDRELDTETDHLSVGFKWKEQDDGLSLAGVYAEEYVLCPDCMGVFSEYVRQLRTETV